MNHLQSQVEEKKNAHSEGTSFGQSFIEEIEK